MLTGESRIDPTRLMLIRRMKRFPICFIISLLGNYNHHTERKERKIISKTCEKTWINDLGEKRRTPIFPVSERLLGISFVCSIVPMMSSSNNDILTDWESACERESFVLSSYLKFVLVEAGGRVWEGRGHTCKKILYAR